MRLHPKHKCTYSDWRAIYAGFDIPDEYILNQAKRTRTPLPEETKAKRYEHMKKLYDEGAPYAWIAKLYRINRSQVYRILNNLPNN